MARRSEIWEEEDDVKFNRIVGILNRENLVFVIKSFWIFVLVKCVKELFICIKYIKVIRVNSTKSIEKR